MTADGQSHLDLEFCRRFGVEVPFDRVRGPDWPEDYDGRALRNSLVTHWERSASEILDDLDRARAGYRIATETADLSQRVVWAGTGVGEIQSIAPADTVIAELAAGFGH